MRASNSPQTQSHPPQAAWAKQCKTVQCSSNCSLSQQPQLAEHKHSKQSNNCSKQQATAGTTRTTTTKVAFYSEGAERRWVRQAVMGVLRWRDLPGSRMSSSSSTSASGSVAAASTQHNNNNQQQQQQQYHHNPHNNNHINNNNNNNNNREVSFCERVKLRACLGSVCVSRVCVGVLWRYIFIN